MKLLKIKTRYNLKQLYIKGVLVEFNSDREAIVPETLVKGMQSKYFAIHGPAKQADTLKPVHVVNKDVAAETGADEAEATPKTRAELKLEAEALGLYVKSKAKVADIEQMIADHQASAEEGE